MSLHLHDTATRSLRAFEPLEPGKASIYLCGLTVQGPPHIGHVRNWVGMDIQIFADGAEVITQTGIAAAKPTFSTLRFGYREYHPHDRTTWYDDVVVAPQRVGCP